MDWISVKDRLPDIDQAVLFYRTKKTNLNSVVAGIYVTYDKNSAAYKLGHRGNGFEHKISGIWFPGEKVTHWMPWPEGPK